MTTIKVVVDAAEQAAKDYDEALAFVRKGEDWLGSHPVSHPLYGQAQQHLAKRRQELARADEALERALSAMKIRVARDGQGELSLNCQVCGKPVSGWPPLKPGHHVHLTCLMR